jgi:hypothetical protein
MVPPYKGDEKIKYINKLVHNLLIKKFNIDKYIDMNKNVNNLLILNIALICKQASF